MKIRLHAFLPHSHANGPRVRAVIWVQGCSLGCPGCFNPETHPFEGGELVEVDELFKRILALGNSIEGITISGGEPLQQYRPILALLKRVRNETDYSVIVFTGYTWEEVQRMPYANELLSCIDVLIAGRYDDKQRLAHSLLGSANKTVHFLTNRYSMKDLEAVPQGEVIITAEGEVLIVGIEPIKF